MHLIKNVNDSISFIFMIWEKLKAIDGNRLVFLFLHISLNKGSKHSP